MEVIGFIILAIALLFLGNYIMGVLWGMVLVLMAGVAWFCNGVVNILSGKSWNDGL